MKSPRFVIVVGILILIAFSISGFAEEKVKVAASSTGVAAPAKAGEGKASGKVEAALKPVAPAKTGSAAPVKPAVKAPPPGKITRWLEVQTANISTRYRMVENSKGVISSNQEQFKDEFKARFKFDKKGNYSINAGVFTGSSFTSSWNTTGIGTGDPNSNHFLKQLYFAAKPIKGVEFQFGGLYLARGESTEITSYDNDGYLMGERVSVKRPKDLFFDEVSVTYAYLGDTSRSNINKRFNRLQKSNYHQFLVSKNIGKRAAVSADYTFASGVETLRQTIKISTKELHLIDSFRFENYQRTDVKPEYGFSIYAEKALHKRFTVGGGFADIDRYYGTLNADRFGIGKRFFIESKLTICPEISVGTFYQHSVATDYTIPNKSRFDLILTYNFLKSLQRTGIF